MLKNRTISAAIFLILILSLTTGIAGAKDQSFQMPKDMKALLPANADMVLAISSLNELDELWRELLPESPDRETATLSHFINEINPEFIEYVDRDKPFLMVVNLQALMSPTPYQITGLMALKDKNFQVAMVPGLEEFNLVRKGNYLAVSTDQTWAPATETPTWPHNLKNGIMSGSINLSSIIEANQFLVEMGLGQLENPDLESTTESTIASAKMLRALMNSIEGLDFTLSQDGQTLSKDLVLRTRPGSDLAPGPQPSFEEALKLTRFLPGGENLLSVSAFDQLKQAQLYRDYYLASLQTTMDLMEPDVAQRYQKWYNDYLNAMPISFAPSAMTLRFEKDNSSFQNIIKSDNSETEWNQLVELGNGMNGFGLGLELVQIVVPSFKGYEIAGWTILNDEKAWENILAQGGSNPLDNPLKGTSLFSIFRFLPGNVYLARVDDYLVFCGGNDPDLMEDLIGRVESGKGQVDPRLKKINKERGGHVQYASTGDLNTLVAVIIEMTEELSGTEDIPWLSEQPLPFKQTYEIDGSAYQFHLEMEKPAVRALIIGIMDMELE